MKITEYLIYFFGIIFVLNWFGFCFIFPTFGETAIKISMILFIILSIIILILLNILTREEKIKKC